MANNKSIQKIQHNNDVAIIIPSSENNNNCDNGNNNDFLHLFSPIAHHVFPDGCPEESLLDAWPIRTTRAIVTYSRKAIKDLHQAARTHGFRLQELESLIYLTCHIVAGQCTSPIISQFSALLRCVIPKAGHQKEDTTIFLPNKILEQLMLVRLDRDDLIQLYQFLNLCLRNRLLISPAQLIPYYPLLLQKCRELDEAVQLVHVITQSRQQVHIYRARRVRQWYDERERISLFYLLELYASLDPKGCLQFVPKDITNNFVTSTNKKPICKINWHWEQELRGVYQQRTKSSSKRRDQIKKKSLLQKPESTENKGLLHTSLASSDTITPLRAHLPYILYEEWYPALNLYQEEAPQDLDSDSDDEDNIMEEENPPTNRSAVSVTQSRIQVINQIADATIYLGKILPESEVFILNTVLPTWDGTDSWGFRLCHDVLTLIRPQAYGRIIPLVEPLLRCGASPQLQYYFLGVVVPQWIIRCSSSSSNGGSHFFLEEKDILRLIQWATSQLQCGFLAATSGHELQRLALLQVYDAVRVATSLLPKPSIVYSLLLSPTPVAINRLCTLLLSYEEMLKEEKDSQSYRKATQERILLYNSYIWDICTILWNGKTTKNTELSRLFQMMPALTRKCGDSLSLARSASFLGYFPKERLKNRAHFVDFLENRGMLGIQAFLVTFVGALADRENRRKRKRNTVSLSDAAASVRRRPPDV